MFIINLVEDCSGRRRKTSAPAVTRRKDIGRMTVRPISFQREKCVHVRPPAGACDEEAHGPPAESVRP